MCVCWKPSCFSKNKLDHFFGCRDVFLPSQTPHTKRKWKFDAVRRLQDVVRGKKNDSFWEREEMLEAKMCTINVTNSDLGSFVCTGLTK